MNKTKDTLNQKPRVSQGRVKLSESWNAEKERIRLLEEAIWKASGFILDLNEQHTCFGHCCNMSDKERTIRTNWNKSLKETKGIFSEILIELEERERQLDDNAEGRKV